MSVIRYAALTGLGLLLAGSAAARVEPSPANLCTARESVAFTCRAGDRAISFCRSGDVLHYRFGRRGSPELSFPEGNPPARTVFRFSSAAYSGGGEARVRFTNGGYDYLVYTALIAGSWNADGTRDHEELDGVLVRKNGRKVANIRCTTSPENDLYPLGDMLPREGFDIDVER